MAQLSRAHAGPSSVSERSRVGPEAQTITLGFADFKNAADGSPLQSWSQLDLLGLWRDDDEPGKPAPEGLAGAEPCRNSPASNGDCSHHETHFPGISCRLLHLRVVRLRGRAAGSWRRR